MRLSDFELLHGEVLLGHFDVGRAHVAAGVAHDVGILIDQEDVVRLDAGGGIGVAGAVPVGLGGEYFVSLGDIVDIIQLALALEHVVGVLGKTGGHGVAVGVSPGAASSCLSRGSVWASLVQK